MSGVHFDPWAQSRWLVCKRCKARVEEIKAELKALQQRKSCHVVFTPEGARSREVKLKEEIKGIQFWWRAYDPRITAIFAKNFPFVTARFPTRFSSHHDDVPPPSLSFSSLSFLLLFLLLFFFLFLVAPEKNRRERRYSSGATTVTT